MIQRGSARMPWSAVGEPVVLEVERILGPPVVSATSQPGGFSPGSADRARACVRRTVRARS